MQIRCLYNGDSPYLFAQARTSEKADKLTSVGIAAVLAEVEKGNNPSLTSMDKSRVAPRVLIIRHSNAGSGEVGSTSRILAERRETAHEGTRRSSDEAIARELPRVVRGLKRHRLSLTRRNLANLYGTIGITVPWRLSAPLLKRAWEILEGCETTFTDDSGNSLD